MDQKHWANGVASNLTQFYESVLWKGWHWGNWNLNIVLSLPITSPPKCRKIIRPLERNKALLTFHKQALHQYRSNEYWWYFLVCSSRLQSISGLQGNTAIHKITKYIFQIMNSKCVSMWILKTEVHKNCLKFQ